MSLFKNMLISAVLLALFAITGTFFVSYTFESTIDKINENKRLALLKAFHVLIPATAHDNDIFNDIIQVTNKELLGSNKEINIYRARKDNKPVAVIINSVAPDGYSGNIELLVAINFSGTLEGVRVVQHKETPGLGDAIEENRSDWITRFKDKSEKLLFEIINEPKGLSQSQNNELHQRVLNIIRRTNPTRNVIIQGHNWGGADELVTMDIPEDDYLIGSFHSYNPWPFGLEGTGTFGSSYQLQELEAMFIMVKQWSDQTGIPVFLGEFACHRSADYNSRMKHYRAYINFSLKYGFTPCSWDDGGNFGVMLRSSRSWNEIKDIL